MRVLFTAFVPSHFMPMVPLSWALRAAGHEVVVAGYSDVTRLATAAGLATAELGSDCSFAENFPAVLPAPAAGARSVIEPMRPELGGSPTARLTSAMPWDLLGAQWQLLVRNAIGDYLAFARSWGPDLIVSELDFNGLIVGGLLKAPVVLHRWGAEVLTTFVRAHATVALHDLCVNLGLPDGLPEPALHLDPAPPALQFPGLPAATSMRFVPYNGTGAVPAWATAPARRRILVSLGMFGSAAVADDWRLAFVRNLAAVVDRAGDIELVLPFGTGFADHVGPLPGTVRIVDQVPLNLVLAGAAAVIHHGGAGTALTAAAAGLPQLVLPQRHPAFLGCAERLEATGAGLSLAPDAAVDNPAALTAAVGMLLDDWRLQAGAARLAAQVSEQPTPAALVGLLESVAG